MMASMMSSTADRVKASSTLTSLERGTGSMRSTCAVEPYPSRTAPFNKIHQAGVDDDRHGDPLCG